MSREVVKRRLQMRGLFSDAEIESLLDEAASHANLMGGFRSPAAQAILEEVFVAGARSLRKIEQRHSSEERPKLQALQSSSAGNVDLVDNNPTCPACGGRAHRVVFSDLASWSECTHGCGWRTCFLCGVSLQLDEPDENPVACPNCARSALEVDR